MLGTAVFNAYLLWTFLWGKTFVLHFYTFSNLLLERGSITLAIMLKEQWNKYCPKSIFKAEELR